MDSVSNFLVVTKLTETMSCQLCFKRKDRPRMGLNSRNLCGIIETGHILSFTGLFPLIPPYRTTLACLFLFFLQFRRVGLPWQWTNFPKGVGRNVGRLLCGLLSNLGRNFMGKPLQCSPQ